VIAIVQCFANSTEPRHEETLWQKKGPACKASDVNIVASLS
jgi:hypothetical protein